MPGLSPPRAGPALQPILGDDRRQLRLTREEDEVDGTVRDRTEDDRECADEEPGGDQQRNGPDPRFRRDPVRQMADRDDDHGNNDCHDDAPREVGQLHAVI
jgi:hypothetical protein